jgi:aspartate 1-decarboxylase
MLIQVLKAKIHRAAVTDSSLDYEGSLEIDTEFLELTGILPYEKILVSNVNTGQRFETYAIPATHGSKTISLNGPTARRGCIGDLLVIMAFAFCTPDEATHWDSKVIILSDGNRTGGVAFGYGVAPT